MIVKGIGMIIIVFLHVVVGILVVNNGLWVLSLVNLRQVGKGRVQV
jgi:hypothetical protein